MSNQSYIHNLGQDFAGALGIFSSVNLHNESVSQEISEKFGGAIQSRIKKLCMSDNTLGRINGASVCCRCTLYQVHCGTYLNKYASGRELLEVIATTAIIAAIADLCQDRGLEARMLDYK